MPETPITPIATPPTDPQKTEPPKSNNLPNADPKPQTINRFKGWVKNHKVWLGVSVIVLVSLIVGIYIALGGGTTIPLITNNSAIPTPTPTPTLRAALLDGTMVPGDVAVRHPLAITVENVPTVRPQTGLSSASIVYEAIVEGGITRFLAIYGPVLPAKVGPVRSARTVFVDIIKEYTPVSAYYAHVGGAPDALATLKSEKLYDMDQFAIGAKAFQRINTAGVSSEHTMYTYPAELYNVATQRKYAAESTFKPWLFKSDALLTNRPETQTIVVPFSSTSYDVTYIYDKISNTYKRQMSGVDFTDALTTKAISPKNIIVQYVTYGTRKGDDKGRQDVGLSGSGVAKVFMDGLVVEGKWSKDTITNRTVFTSAATGKQIELNAGQTFVELVKSDAIVTVK